MNTNSIPTDIRDIKGLVPLPGWPWWVWLLITLVVAGLAVLVWWLLRRKPAEELPLPPILLSPYEVALAALGKLKDDWPDVEVFYTRLSNIIRHYIEDRFGLRAPERTTEEFLAAATLPDQQMKLLGNFLQEADLVKFARHRPGREDMERVYGAAERFVRETGQPSTINHQPSPQ